MPRGARWYTSTDEQWVAKGTTIQTAVALGRTCGEAQGMRNVRSRGTSSTSYAGHLHWRDPAEIVALDPPLPLCHLLFVIGQHLIVEHEVMFALELLQHVQ